MTFGTESIPKSINFGPGNQFVTVAKQLATQFGVAIDMPAGPSELLIVADDMTVLLPPLSFLIYYRKQNMVQTAK
jgi:histidinol dehydrogenase